MDNNLVFKLNFDDFNHLFKISGLRGNNLSPFKTDIEQSTNENPSKFFQELLKSDSLQEFSEIILEPDLVINFKSGGSISEKDFYQVFFSKKHSKIIAQFKNSENQFINILFKNFNNFMSWWSDLYCSIGQEGYNNIISGNQELETVICFFAGLDFYKRASLESMLEYNPQINNSIYINDFLDLIKSSLASADTRWLLPTLFELNQTLKKQQISLQPKHLESLKNLGFFTTIQNNTITLSNLGQAIGVEFLTNWLGAIGIEIITTIKEEPVILAQAFLTATAFTNHLILITENNDNYVLNYQTNTKSEVIINIENLINNYWQVTEGNIDSEQIKFCGECGEKILIAKKFCTKCGALL